MTDAPPTDVLESIARETLTQTLHLRRGASVVIEAWTHMLPWSNAFVFVARQLGIRPMVLYEDETTYWRSVDAAKASDIGRLPTPEAAAIAKTDGYVFLWGPADRPRLQALPAEQRQALLGYNSGWYELAAKAKLRGCRIEYGRATDAAAVKYGVDGPAWRAELLAASQVDRRAMVREGARVARRLAQGRSITLSHANGTRLALQLARRRPVVDDGVVDAEDVRQGNNLTSIPGGAVYVALDETVAAGTLVANRTSYPPAGTMTGGRWTFQENHLTEFSYASGEDEFRTAYEAAAPARDRPGILSVGLNPRIRASPGLEELERGAVLVGIGSNTSYGGKTTIPFQSWLVLAGAHLEVDGRALVADGEIL
jgi:leucyl aminopeptidase (aminopeptidase T)